MAVKTKIERRYLVAFLFLVAVVIVAFSIRLATSLHLPSIDLVTLEGRDQKISLSQVKCLPSLTRIGRVQNQYGNWLNDGVYTGVRLTDLIGPEADYEVLLIEAADGYTIEIERERVEDLDYPMALAYAYNGVEVPDWKDGFCIAVLPEDGDVSNEEYGVPSAGSFWVKNVTKITLGVEGVWPRGSLPDHRPASTDVVGGLSQYIA